MWLLYLVFLCLCTCTYTCPDDTVPMKNLDFKDLANGRWFEIARYDSFAEQKDADCVFFEFTSNVEPYTYTAHEIVNGSIFPLSGKIYQISEAKDAILLDTVNFNGVLKNFTYSILDTDFTTYMLLYHCRFDANKKAESECAWITSRTPKLNDDAKLAVTKYIDTHKGLDKNKFAWNHFTHEACLLDV